MNSIPFGKLEQFHDLRTFWPHEASDFTPWLANNLSLLGETIGRELELKTTEYSVGNFKADILARDLETGAWVIIENQLEETDHNHLGQLLTYAAGLKATTLIWIATAFTDEHRATLDWLNEVTHGTIACFGLEIEIWRVGESLPAPRFNIRCSPNTWVKQVEEHTEQREVHRAYLQQQQETMLALLDSYGQVSTNKWKQSAYEQGIPHRSFDAHLATLQARHAIVSHGSGRIGTAILWRRGSGDMEKQEDE